MFEEITNFVKDITKIVGAPVVRLDIQFNNIKCEYSARATWADGTIYDIKQGLSGLFSERVEK